MWEINVFVMNYKIRISINFVNSVDHGCTHSIYFSSSYLQEFARCDDTVDGANARGCMKGTSCGCQYTDAKHGQYKFCKAGHHDCPKDDEIFKIFDAILMTLPLGEYLPVDMTVDMTVVSTVDMMVDMMDV